MTQPDTTVIARHTYIKGELHLDGPALIAGRVDGAIIAQDALEIAPDGIVEGDIHGVLIDIQGSVQGNISASRACRLGTTARVTGELRAANLAIAEGACFVGQVHVGGTAAAPEQYAPEQPTPAPLPDLEEEISAAQAVVGTINRLESMTADIEELAVAAAPAPQPPTPQPSTPTVRVFSQTVQQTLNRSPKIIKAR